MLTSDIQSKIPAAGYVCNCVSQAGAALQSWHVCEVAKSQLTSVILSTHKHLSILYTKQIWKWKEC